MKCILRYVTLFLIVCLLVGCSTSENFAQSEAEQSLNNPQAQEIEPSVEADDPYEVIDSFILEYNKVSDMEITDTDEIDITDKSNEYYRTEFRLAAFQGAPAKRGTIGNATIVLINYGSLNRDGFRIYVFADSEEELKNIFVTASILFDNSISMDEIENAFSKFETAGSFLLGDNVSGTISSFEFMLNDDSFVNHQK